MWVVHTQLGSDQQARQPRRAIGALLEAQQLSGAQAERDEVTAVVAIRSGKALAEGPAVVERTLRVSTACARMLCCAITA